MDERVNKTEEGVTIIITAEFHGHFEYRQEYLYKCFQYVLFLQNSKKPGARLPGTSGQGEEGELLAGPLVRGAPGDCLVEEGCGPEDTFR